MTTPEQPERPWWRSWRTWWGFTIGLGVSWLVSLTPDSWWGG
ncbi:hypothetical protein SAMN06893096_103235 [Geodermatophilus pulveris]|uniref:Uncharacterized protein n=1 Tax=Geodermatophilus pulveris TaxID=1564159 RepID=A0A239DLM8_9ACTN|nr:hypothetical protein [Geodermatophilus pulveris]SNS32732.1 hypothetical protein SAMN06893096_103235 [Geodermatophilus pulveris]